MSMLVYRALYPDNLFRLISLGGHTVEEIANAFEPILQHQIKHLGLILDIRHGFPLMPKEYNRVLARNAQQAGVETCTFAVMTTPCDLENIKTRYEQYPRLLGEYLEMSVALFTNEQQATDWTVTTLGNKKY